MLENDHFPNLLQIHIEEPTTDASQNTMHHALADAPATAEKRYRAIVQVLISQLTGLQNTHLRIIVSPAIPEAVEAVSFWLLPLFRGNITKGETYFHFTPEQHAPSFSIEFTADQNADTADYEKIATLSAYCPECSARWINTAMMQCSENSRIYGNDYLSIKHHLTHEQTSQTELPNIPSIKTAADWERAVSLDSDSPSPLAPKLRKIIKDL